VSGKLLFSFVAKVTIHVHNMVRLITEWSATEISVTWIF